MTTDRNARALIAATPIFAGLSEELLDTLAAVAAIEEHPDGTLLFREGDPGDRWYVVVDGTIEIVRTVRDGDVERSIHLTTLGAGDSFGEISVFDGKPRSAGALVRGATCLITLERATLEPLLDARPAEIARLLVSVIGTLSATVRRATQDLVTVYETGKIAGSIRELDALAARILAQVHTAVGADRSALGVWNPYVEDYEWTAHGGATNEGAAAPAPFDAMRADLDELVQRAFEVGEAISVDRGTGGWLGASAMAVPIWSEAEGLGLLVCASDRPGVLGPDQRRLASIVALQVGGAIAIARHEQERRDRERLERARAGFVETA